MSVTQQNSDLSGDSTEFADKAKKWKNIGTRREDKMDSPIHTDYIQSGGATSLISIVDGANAVGSFVTRSTVLWNIAVPLDGMKLEYEFLRMSASFHAEQERSVVDSAGIFTLKFGRGKTLKVLSLWWSKPLKIRRGWSQRRRCLEHARKTIGTCRATDNTTGSSQVFSLKVDLSTVS